MSGLGGGQGRGGSEVVERVEEEREEEEHQGGKGCGGGGGGAKYSMVPPSLLRGSEIIPRREHEPSLLSWRGQGEGQVKARPGEGQAR